MNFADRTVSRTFREGLAEALPRLADNRAYWRMIQHLVFGTRRDVDTGYLMIPADLLAAMEDRTPGSNYSGMKFVEAFQCDVLRFEIEDYVLHPIADLCRCRSVRSIEFPPNVLALIAAERRCHNKEDVRVWMCSGNVFLRKHASARRKTDQAQALALSQEDTVNPNTRVLLDYLNNLPPNRFSSALKHLPEAVEAAERLKDRDNQLNLLSAIRDNAQPLYVPTERSTRVTSMRESILRLHRDLRKIMTQDWITADLKSAQLAIIARVWNVSALTEYLKAGKSIWPDLCGHMGLRFDPDNKAIVKRLLYACIFGAGNDKMRLILSRDFENASEAFRQWKGHPVVRSVLRARARQLRQIRLDGGAVDAFGNWTDIQWTAVEDGERRWNNARSIMACVAQSYELALLMPAVNMAISEQFDSHGFTVMTWLHDGFSFDVHHRENAESWQSRLCQAVNERADSLGIITGLEF